MRGTSTVVISRLNKFHVFREKVDLATAHTIRWIFWKSVIFFRKFSVADASEHSIKNLQQFYRFIIRATAITCDLRWPENSAIWHCLTRNSNNNNIKTLQMDSRLWMLRNLTRFQLYRLFVLSATVASRTAGDHTRQKKLQMFVCVCANNSKLLTTFRALKLCVHCTLKRVAKYFISSAISDDYSSCSMHVTSVHCLFRNTLFYIMEVGEHQHLRENTRRRQQCRARARCVYYLP